MTPELQFRAPSAQTMIFHHPRPVLDGAPSGSGVRPRRMLDAFRAIGFEVEEITGYSRDRRRTANRLLQEIGRGRRFEFAYAESATTPHALSDPHHYPRRPLLDARLFHALRRRGIPVGLFYRDIYWRFPDYDREATAPKRAAARVFYRIDLLSYARTLDVLFLPSVAMSRVLSVDLRHVRIEALPPGAPESGTPQSKTRKDEPLQLLYVGGVVPPLYDLADAIAAVGGVEGVHLTICCRDFEAGALPLLPANCSVVHEHGEGVARLYDQADLALLVLGPHRYRDFAVPVKLFEAVGHGVPTVASTGTAAGELVAKHGLGITVSGADRLAAALRSMVNNRGQLTELQTSVQRARHEHTWSARARQAARSLRPE